MQVLICLWIHLWYSLTVPLNLQSWRRSLVFNLLAEVLVFDQESAFSCWMSLTDKPVKFFFFLFNMQDISQQVCWFTVHPWGSKCSFMKFYWVNWQSESLPRYWDHCSCRSWWRVESSSKALDLLACLCSKTHLCSWVLDHGQSDSEVLTLPSFTLNIQTFEADGQPSQVFLLNRMCLFLVIYSQFVNEWWGIMSNQIFNKNAGFLDRQLFT